MANSVVAISDPLMRTAVSAALLALGMFKVDAIALVRAGVEADIEAAHGLPNPPSVQECKARRSNLRKWEGAAKPFAAEAEGYFPLLRAVVTDPDLVAQGLPGAKTNKMSVIMFCSHVYDVAKDGGIKACMMIQPKGSFLPVCRAAARAIAALSGSKTNAQEHKHIFTKAFAKALAMSDINHFPYQSTAVLPGRVSTAPIWDSWCSFGGVEPTADRTIRTATLLPSESVGLALRTALSGASDSNILGDWLCAHVSLGDLPDVLKHEKLPENFKRLGDADYVTRNMDWVIDNFDFANKVHTLALLYGFIVKYMNPAIFTDKRYTTELKTMATGNTISTLASLRTLRWKTKDAKGNNKGNTQTDVFVVMFTAFVIGLYEKESPLRDYMDANKDTLGLALTTKYGTFRYLWAN